MANQRWRTDHLLWGLATGAVFVPLAFVDLLGGGGKGEYSLWAYFRQLVEGGLNAEALVLAMIVQGVFLALPAAAVGWLIQAVAVMCGLRLSGRQDRQQIRDYAEPDAAPGFVPPRSQGEPGA